MKGKQELFINDSAYLEKNDDNVKNKREYYEKRPSSFENQLMRQFAAPIKDDRTTEDSSKNRRNWSKSRKS